ncbi:MAG: response regulator [Gammaproteobacteria bacterium]|nr:response regulator [Gammaproteobacteria bacterium]
MDKDSESGRKRVLVVDDSESILKLVDEQLRMEGFDVATASNANDAVSWCDSNGAPDLLLSDVSMPEVDGPTLHRLLDSRFPGIPVLFMSGGSVNSLAEFPWPLLDKPFTHDQLRTMINVSLFQAYVAKVVSD